MADEQGTLVADEQEDAQGSPGEQLVRDGGFGDDGETPTHDQAPPQTAADSEPETDVESEGEPEAPEPEAPGFLDQLAELGFENVEDEETAKRRLLEAYQQTSQTAEEARREAERERAAARQYWALTSDPNFQEFARQTYGRQPAESGQAAESQPERREPWWNPPASPEDLQRAQQYMTVNEQTGQREWKADAPPELRQRVEQQQQYINEWSDKLVTRPHEALQTPVTEIVREAIEAGDSPVTQAIERYIENKLGEREQSRQAETFVEQIEREHGNWLYKQDPVTGRPQTDSEGNRVPTAEGERLFAHLKDAEEMEIPSVEAQWRYAYAMYQNETARQNGVSRQASSEAQRTREQKRREHLQRGAEAPPNRNGAEPRTDDDLPQNTKQRPGETLVADMHARGVL